MVAGLTGGIGSGKSMVAKLFEMLGCCVFNSDQAAKEIYFDKAVNQRVIALLGKDAYLSEQHINRSYISQKIFNDSSLMQQLNAIIHPAVLNSFVSFKNAHAGKIIIKETALLFETGQQAGMDKVIVVEANDELRIARAMQRDGLNREEAWKKLNSQMPQAEKIKQADLVIHNNENEFLITQVLAVYNQLKS